MYRNLPRTPALCAVADQNGTLAENARRKLGFQKAYGDWRRLIEAPEVHVVHITTPNRLHLDVALAASERQISGRSTGFQPRSAELWAAVSTKASPFTPSSTVGKGRSIWSGGSCRIRATTALAKSE